MHGQTQDDKDHMDRGQPFRRDKAYFVPGQLCVVVATNPSPRAEKVFYEQVYKEVQQLLNSAIVVPSVHMSASAEKADARFDLVPRTQGQDAPFTLAEVTGGLFERDLALSARTWQNVRPHADGLFFQERTRTTMLDPYVVLAPPASPRRSLFPLTLLQFHNIRLAEDAEVTREQHVALVRELVNVTNRRFGRRLAGRNSRWQILGATPNWLNTTAADPEGGGSPGTPPEPVEDEGGERFAGSRNWTFRFEDTPKARGINLSTLVEEERALAAQESSRPSNVAVAVLDTCPEAKAVGQNAARGGYAGTAAAPNLWNRVLDGANRLHIDEGPAVKKWDWSFAQFLNIVPDWRGAMELRPATLDAGEWVDHRAERYGIADHGLFVAGIIRDIAPRAQVHLIRVLDDTGVGDLRVIAEELAYLPTRFREHLDSGGKLIVNLSLTATVPTSDELLREWFAETHGDAGEIARRWPDICAALDALHASLAELMTWLTDQGILVVAAAGNDSYRTDAHLARHAPAFPARYDNVLGVSAMSRGGQPATYANRGDEVLFGNGVATYGGNATLFMPSGGPPDIETGVLKIATYDGVRDAVIGLYSSPTLPAISGVVSGATTNHTGWAYWAGTSFATPIIAGIAANLWARDDSPPDPEGIIASVQELATVDEQTGDGLACNGIRAWQEAT